MSSDVSERFDRHAFQPSPRRGINQTGPVLGRDRVAPLHGAGVHIGNTDICAKRRRCFPLQEDVGEGSHAYTYTKRIAQRQDETYRDLRYAIRMEPHERLRLARQRAGYETAADAARRHAWSLVTYRAHENGVRGLTLSNVGPYAKAFRVTEAWLLTGEGGSPATVRLVGKAGAGPDGEVVFSEVEGGLGDVAAPNNATPSTKGLEVSGDSMRGVANDGWLIFYDEDGLAPAEEMIGELCVCWLEDGRTLIKFLQPGRDGTFDLESLNAPTMRDVSLRAAALVTSIVPRKPAMKMMKGNPAIGKRTAVMK